MFWYSRRNIIKKKEGDKMKAIEFEILQDNCKHCKNIDECIEADNFSGKCEKTECPIWNDLDSCEIDM